MALVRKAAGQANSALEGKTSAVTAREAEAQRKKARTLAKQQQAAERIAAATSELASGIAEASSAAEELKRASDQIALETGRQRSAFVDGFAHVYQFGFQGEIERGLIFTGVRGAAIVGFAYGLAHLAHFA